MDTCVGYGEGWKTHDELWYIYIRKSMGQLWGLGDHWLCVHEFLSMSCILSRLVYDRIGSLEHLNKYTMVFENRYSYSRGTASLSGNSAGLSNHQVVPCPVATSSSYRSVIN